MNPVVTPLHPLFVAKITAIDLGRPIDETTQRGDRRRDGRARRACCPVNIWTMRS